MERAERVLSCARDDVARDLADPAYEPLLMAAVEDRRWWIEQWPDGADLLVCLLAQDVQEAVHVREPLWPLCPEHGDHPLFVEPDLGPDPFWVCHRTGLPIAAVGNLPEV